MKKLSAPEHERCGSTPDADDPKRTPTGRGYEARDRNEPRIVPLDLLGNSRAEADWLFGYDAWLPKGAFGSRAAAEAAGMVS